MRFKKLPRAKPYIGRLAILFALLRLPFDELNRTRYAESIDKSVADALGFKYAISVSSCRMALYLALKSLSLKNGDEVLLSPVTIPDVVNAIHTLGLRPVFVDLDPRTHFIDADTLTDRITDRTRVLLLTHLSGLVPDIDPALRIAKMHGLHVIEDISQSYNSSFEGKPVGTFGLAAVGSFCISKTLASLGGGILLTDDEDYYRAVRTHANSLLTRPRKGFVLSQILLNSVFHLVTHDLIFSLLVFHLFRIISRFAPERLDGLQRFRRSDLPDSPLYANACVLREAMPKDAFSWFSDLQARVLESSLARLEEQDGRRILLARRFLGHLDSRLAKNVPRTHAGERESVFWHLPYATRDRGDLQLFLLKHGIDAIGFALQNCARVEAFGIYRQACPGADEVTDTTLLLPIHSDFSEADMEYMAETVGAYEAKDA